MFPAESLLFDRATSGWVCIPPLCPADPPGTGLCDVLTTKFLLSVLLPAWFLKLRNVRFPHSANTCGTSFIVLAVRELVLGLEALWCLMEAIYFAALSFLFPILQLHTAFPSHSCHWELQCKMGVCSIAKFTLYMR